MDIFQLKLEESAWYIIPCLLVAATYAYLLYRKNTLISRGTTYILGCLRFLAVFLICFLLLSPFVNHTKNTFEKPVIAFIVDNSTSIVLEQSTTIKDSIVKSLQSTATSLAKSDIETTFFDLNNIITLDSLQFINDETNLSEALKNTRDGYFNRNLAAIVLISDGIYNRGASPENLIINKPLYTLGLGDTTLQKDLAIHEIKTNKTAYIKNSFPIKTTIQHHGYSGKKITVSLLEKDSIIGSQEITLNNSGFQEITFHTSKSAIGIYNYRIKLTELKGEITYKNNHKNVFIEIINNKEKILLYALSPHPDIKTIRKIIDQLERYELELYIEGISKTELKPEDYHLIIAHQTPSIGKKGLFTERVLNANTPKLFIVGNQTDLRTFSSINKTLIINGNNAQKDEVNAYINPDFEKFKTDNNYINELLPNTPPVSVPFADYQIKGNTSVLLYQQVGSIKTDKPLLILQQTNGLKEGVLIGEGYWRWAIFEYSEKQEHKLLNDILSKTIQFLISKEDKNKLIVKPKKQDFYTSEIPSFEIQTLNDLSEPISGIPVTVTISQNNTTKFKLDYVSDMFRESFPMTSFEEGTYSYNSSATISNQKHYSNGAFTIKKKQLEEFDLQANHYLLKEISNNNNGKFYTFNKHTELVDELVSQNFKKVIHSQETNKPLRETWWYLLIIIALLTAEWILRKVKGSRI